MNDYLQKLKNMAMTSSSNQPADIRAFSGTHIERPIVRPPIELPPENAVTQNAVPKQILGGIGNIGGSASLGEASILPMPWEQHNYLGDKIKALGFHYGGLGDVEHPDSVSLGKVPSWTECGMEHPCINYGRVAPVKDPKQMDMKLKSASYDTPSLDPFHVGFDHHHEGEHFVDLQHVLSSADEITHYVHEHDMDHDKKPAEEEEDKPEEMHKEKKLPGLPTKKKNPGYVIKHHWSDPILDMAHIDHRVLYPDFRGNDAHADLPARSHGDEDKEEVEMMGSGDGRRQFSSRRRRGRKRRRDGFTWP